jgi:hypothetical protein
VGQTIAFRGLLLAKAWLLDRRQKTIVCPTLTLTRMWKLQARRLSACATYFVAMIESTWIVFVAASSVPFTVTFLAANFSALFWSLSVYASLPS